MPALRNDADQLRAHGIQPSAQRVAVASYILHTPDHPSADEVWSRVRESFPMISRATIYNTLHLFEEHGLVRSFVLTEGKVVFDPHVEDHHHFIDEDSGRIIDIPWNRLRVSGVPGLRGFAVRQYQVVMRGRQKASSRSAQGGRKRKAR